MKRVTILALVLLLSLFGSILVSCSKKKSEDKSEMVKAQKIAFFTEKLNLTPEEAQLFWPVYNEYWRKKNELIEERKAAMQFCAENINKLSEEELGRYTDMYINFHKRESDLLIEFNAKFKEVLPNQKVMKLYLADYDFKTYLLKQIRKSGKD